MNEINSIDFHLPDMNYYGAFTDPVVARNNVLRIWFYDV